MSDTDNSHDSDVTDLPQSAITQYLPRCGGVANANQHELHNVTTLLAASARVETCWMWRARWSRTRLSGRADAVQFVVCFLSAFSLIHIRYGVGGGFFCLRRQRSLALSQTKYLMILFYCATYFSIRVNLGEAKDSFSPQNKQLSSSNVVTSDNELSAFHQSGTDLSF